MASEAIIGAGDATPFVYAALGASTAVGTGATGDTGGYVLHVASHIAALGFCVSVQNLAKNGVTMQQIAEEQLPLLAQIRPDLITVSAGSNDIFKLVSYKKFQKFVQEIIYQTSETRAKVLFANTPNNAKSPAILWPLTNYMQWKATQQNETLGRVASGIPIVRIIDVFSLSTNQPLGQSYYATDGFHPSDAGYKLWGNEFISKLTD